MAQLYKMTLYVCDLEESLSLDEIETLIKQDVLNGISVNCISHFADRQIGEQVEWADNIDLNRCGCPTSTWDKYFNPPKKPQTNADRIRAMSDEELKSRIYELFELLSGPKYYDFATLFCDGKAGCVSTEGSIVCNTDRVKTCIARWLQRPMEEGSK